MSTENDNDAKNSNKGRATVSAGEENPLPPGAYQVKNYANSGHMKHQTSNRNRTKKVVRPKPESYSHVHEPVLPGPYQDYGDSDKMGGRRSRFALVVAEPHPELCTHVQERQIPWHEGLQQVDEELGGTMRACEGRTFTRTDANCDTEARIPHPVPPTFPEQMTPHDVIAERTRRSDRPTTREKREIQSAMRASLGVGALAVTGPGADDRHDIASRFAPSTAQPVHGEFSLDGMTTTAVRGGCNEEEAGENEQKQPFVLCGIRITARRCFAIAFLLAVVVGASVGIVASTGGFGSGETKTAVVVDTPPPTPIPTPAPSPTAYDPPECRQSRLPRDDGDATEYDHFGTSVAISGNTAVVGADSVLPPTSSKPKRSGTAYVYTRDDALTWKEQARLQSNEKMKGDEFGRSVALDGDTVVIGAIDTDIGLNQGVTYGAGVGCAYVFTRTTGTDGEAWTQQAKLLPDNPREADVTFGSPVAVYGDTIIIGMDFVGGSFSSGINSGSFYVFTRSGDEWMQQARIFPTDGQTHDRFGHSVALYDNTAVIGAPRADINGKQNSGAVYVYVRSDGNWTLQDKLLPKDDGGKTNDAFGTSVAVHDDTVVVGAASYDSEDQFDTGSAYVFVRVGGKWAQQAQLLARDGQAKDSFGQSVALDGDTIVVGTSGGAAYVFRLIGASSWVQRNKLLATTDEARPLSSGDVEDMYGESVGLDGNTVIIGAHGDDKRGENSGSAYAKNLC